MMLLLNYSSEVCISNSTVFTGVKPEYVQCYPIGKSGPHNLHCFNSKSEKQWKVLRDCLNKLPTGILSGHQTFPLEFPRTIFSDNPFGLSTVCTRPAGGMININIFTFANLSNW